MYSLGQEISKLTNPTPEIFDPEDDIDAENTKSYPEINETSIYETSQLRSKTAPLLEDIDSSYAGRKVSRKSLGRVFQQDKKAPFELNDLAETLSDNLSESDDSDIELNHVGDKYRESDDDVDEEDDASDDDIDEEDDASDDDLSDSDIMKFKKLISNEESISDEGEENISESAEDDEEELLQTNDSMVKLHDVSNEMEKGEAVKNQKEIWNRLLESRIKLQKLLVIANKLPQKSTFQKLRDQGGKEFDESLKKSCNGLQILSTDFLLLESEIIGKNTNLSGEENSDEEKLNLKRKSHIEDLDDVLEKRFKSIIPYRNSVLLKWDEKTRVSTGRMTQKSFMAFDNSALKQIEQILQDKNRLIKRTQLKRSLYRVFGEKDEDIEDASTSKIFDPEIFDDQDFYRQILKDVIDSKSYGFDPAVVRKQMEIQKIRNKMKRKVDTKASKGRKLRFDVHPKLLNFMAPVQIGMVPDDARGNLLMCLFGKTS